MLLQNQIEKVYNYLPEKIFQILHLILRGFQIKIVKYSFWIKKLSVNNDVVEFAL